MFCTNCGKEISGEMAFCQHCGNPINASVDTSEPVKNNAGSFFRSIQEKAKSVSESISAAAEEAQKKAEEEKKNLAMKADNRFKTNYDVTDEMIENENQTQVAQDDKSNKSDRIIGSKNIIVSTGDLRQNYEIIGPVYFQVSNKGLFSSALSTLIKKYQDEIQEMKSIGQFSEERMDWGFLYGEWSVGANDFDKAFFISVQELKKRAAMLGADAIICMRQDIDIDTNGFAYFYLQMYGTAVKFVES